MAHRHAQINHTVDTPMSLYGDIVGRNNTATQSDGHGKTKTPVPNQKGKVYDLNDQHFPQIKEARLVVSVETTQKS